MHNRAGVTGPFSTRAACLALAVVGLVVSALAGVAIARTFTLNVAKHATVTNQSGMTTHPNIIVNSRDLAVYTLSGDSKTHPECRRANSCFSVWPPVTVASASKLSRPAAVKGRLAIWHRNGFNQVLLNGHPLYTFSGDQHRATAIGEALRSFGGTWHVIRVTG
jgi:predicted lipoprotein with Yx(FWY)xxD motif